MKHGLWCGLALLAALLFAAGPALAQEHPEHPKGGEHPKKDEHHKKDEHPKGNEHPGGDKDKAVHEAWEKSAQPNENHKVLEQFAGSFTSVSKMSMNPAEPPKESPGTVEAKVIMGGRFLLHEHKGNFMGKPFEGMGVIGYDNVKKKYTSTWLDNMGTVQVHGEGTWDAATKTLTETGAYDNPTGEGKMPFRNVWKLTEKGFTFTMYDILPDGKETAAIEVTYTRK